MQQRLIQAGPPLEMTDAAGQLDLRLGEWSYRVRALSCPAPINGEQRLQPLSSRVNWRGAVLETVCVYMCPCLNPEAAQEFRGGTLKIHGRLIFHR